MYKNFIQIFYSWIITYLGVWSNEGHISSIDEMRDFVKKNLKMF